MTSKTWAKTGFPLGLVAMCLYFAWMEITGTL
jgi:hypothetical protein